MERDAESTAPFSDTAGPILPAPPLPTPSLVRKTLSEQIYDALKQEILSGQIAFGQKLVNRELQKRFQVSSTPVRDAINHLFMDGLMEDISNVGARVISFNLQYALEVTEVISTLHATALRRCMNQGVSDNMLETLENLLRHQASSQTAEEHVHTDSQFHLMFFEHCGNRQLQRIFHQYAGLQELLVRYFQSLRKDWRDFSITQHSDILRAVRRGSLVSALEQVELHYQEAVDTFQMHLK